MKLSHTLTLLLFLSLGANVYFLTQQDTNLDKKAFCSQYNEQASKRINTYYTNGDQSNVYPTELFYSPVVESCVAVWKNSAIHDTGMEENFAIFDAITNEDYFSSMIFDLFESDTQFEQRNTNIRNNFDEELTRLRGQE